MFFQGFTIAILAVSAMAAPSKDLRFRNLNRRDGLQCQLWGEINNQQTQTISGRQEPTEGEGGSGTGTINSQSSAWDWGVQLLNPDGSQTGIWGSGEGDWGWEQYPSPSAMQGITVPKSQTDLAADIVYMPTYSQGTWSGCTCTYNGGSNSTNTQGSTYVGALLEKESQSCTCTFPCAPPTYQPGQCGIHVVQHQKADPATDPYTYDVTVYDNGHVQVGGVTGQAIAAQQTYGLDSRLPNVIEIKSGNVDDDPVTFSYAGDTWNSNDSPQCSVGQYDSGSRQMDCGFACS